MLEDSNDSTEMVWSIELPTNEAKVARESVWLFFPVEIWVTFTNLNCACNE